MTIAAIIVGIDGWERYTLPLLNSLRQHEPSCEVVVIDNASAEPYPRDVARWARIERTPRLCYSAAINTGKSWLGSENVNADWYIVLSNDVLCTGPFGLSLAEYDGNDLVGPLLKQAHGFDYLEGWCVCVPDAVWESVGGWDNNFEGSDYEDVDYSTMARVHGFGLVEDTRLPFTHLDQRQRFHVVEDFWGKNSHNREYFLRKHARVTA